MWLVLAMVIGLPVCAGEWVKLSGESVKNFDAIKKGEPITCRLEKPKQEKGPPT